MDGAPPPSLDVDELREQAQAQARGRYRAYALVLAVMCLVVGAWIGMAMTREQVHPGDVLTPPPYWGQVCVPDARVEGGEVGLPISVWPAAPHPTAAAAPLRVYVSGAVAQPGVITLPPASLLADALDAVGGATHDADLDSVNLAAPLTDNQHVLIPRRVATQQPAAEAVPTPVPVEARVNINTASAAELETLPHIGPAMAQRIIAYRETHGPFAQIEDIQNVEGIGPTRYRDLAPLIVVE